MDQCRRCGLTSVHQLCHIHEALCNPFTAVRSPETEPKIWMLLPISSVMYIWVMKTTIELSDGLLHEARKVAARERTTLRALVEQGLRQVLAERTRKPAFRLRKASFKGQGLRPEAAEAGWDRLRDLAYEGRGS